MRLTKRGEVVLAIGIIAISLLALTGIYKVATSVHWTEQGYCWGTFQECYGEE